MFIILYELLNRPDIKRQVNGYDVVNLPLSENVNWALNNEKQSNLTEGIIPSDDSLPTHFLISNISQHTIDLMDYIFSVKQVVPSLHVGMRQ